MVLERSYCCLCPLVIPYTPRQAQHLDPSPEMQKEMGRRSEGSVDSGDIFNPNSSMTGFQILTFGLGEMHKFV